MVSHLQICLFIYLEYDPNCPLTSFSAALFNQKMSYGGYSEAVFCCTKTNSSQRPNPTRRVRSALVVKTGSKQRQKQN